MLALLVLFGGLHYARAVSDITKDTNYVIRRNATCSSEVFFHQGVGLNSLEPALCYLCFCQSSDTAVCWKRESKHCDLEHYRNFGKRNSRIRRSPLNKGEIFVRDAARDFFNKHSPEQCKPLQSSFSDGCPPVDWCTGCTVCDCDANGHWDCHVLSFCTDKNGKKQMKKRRGRQSITSTTNAAHSTKIITKSPKKTIKSSSVKPKNKRNQTMQPSAINKHKIDQIKAAKVNKYASVKKPLPKLQAKKAVPSRIKVTRRPLYIKKNVSANIPLTIKSKNVISTKNNTVEIAQNVLKEFMSNMQKVIKNLDVETNETKEENELIRKRSSMERINNGSREIDRKYKFLTKPITNVNKRDFHKRNETRPHSSITATYGRIKRQVTVARNASNKDDSKDSYKWKIVNGTVGNLQNNRQNEFVNNYTSSILNIPHKLSNTTGNLAQLTKSMNQKINITDNVINIDKKHSPAKDKILIHVIKDRYSTIHWLIGNNSLQINNLNNKSINVIISTTSRPYLKNVKQSTKNNVSDLIQSVPEIKYHDQNFTFEKEKIYSIASQTEIKSKKHCCKFRTLFQNLKATITDENNNTINGFETVKKPKTYTILTKIKRLFKQILHKRNKNRLHYMDGFHYRDHDINQFGYKSSRYCKLNSKEKNKLRQKIIQLKTESENVLKTIGIIKGLLHILEINTNEMKQMVSNDFYKSQENIKKLNNILKNNNYELENSKKMTDDQRTEVKYIKENVQSFIKSIGKFAGILDTIIHIATCHHKSEKENDKLKVNKDNVNNDIIIDHSAPRAKLEKLKQLILNYNVLQNKFIKKIYVILNNLETNVRDKYIPKNSYQNEVYIKDNKTNTLETNSANIIKNIRKLKHLVERINTQNRRKRETIDDDGALEYLLFLMEYLLKRRSPVDQSENDSIDLLIEAIKNAPDVKLIKKKVLNNINEGRHVIRSTPVNLFEKHSNDSDLNIPQKQKKYSSDVNKNKMRTADQSEDSDDNSDDEEFYRYFKYNRLSSSEKKQDDSSSMLNATALSNESYYNARDATTRENNNKVNGVLRNKSDDSLDEEVSTAPTNNVVVALDTTSVSPDIESDIVNEQFKNQIKFNGNIDNFLIDTRANIDWIEENFKEIKQSREVETRSSTLKSLITTPKSKNFDNIRYTTSPDHVHNENMSDVTIENTTNDKKKIKKTSAEEDLISKKQFDLLNSLDYVEDETDSKDDKFSE